MRTIRSQVTAACTSALLAAAGLTTLVSPSAAADDHGHHRHHHARAVHVYVGEDSVLRMRTHLRAGVTKFVVRSAADAGFQLLRPHRGYTKQDFAEDTNAAFNNNDVDALKRFESGTTLLGGVSSSADQKGVMWVRLHRGTYWALDTNSEKTDATKVLSLHVRGRAHGRHSHGRAPRPDAVIRAINETDWAPRPRSIPGSGVLSFRNNSADNHFIAMARLLPGKTMKDFAAWIEKAKNGEEAPPPVDETGGFDSGVVSPGHRMSARYDLPRGRYVLVCFWPDADMDGMPHAFMGMYRGIRVR